MTHSCDAYMYLSTYIPLSPSPPPLPSLQTHGALNGSLLLPHRCSEEPPLSPSTSRPSHHPSTEMPRLEPPESPCRPQCQRPLVYLVLRHLKLHLLPPSPPPPLLPHLPLVLLCDVQSYVLRGT